MTEHNTQELVAKLRDGCVVQGQYEFRDDAATNSLMRQAADLIEAQAAEIARHEPWPEWATTILRVIRNRSGYDGQEDADDGIDLPGELEELLEEMDSEADRFKQDARAAFEVESYKKDVEHYRVKFEQEKDRASKAEAALAAMTAERDAALAQAAAMREALEGLADVFEHDCGVDPCALSMAPAEHYLGLAREALSTEAAPPTAAEKTARSQLEALRNALLNPPPYACAAVTAEFADEATRHESAGSWIVGHRAFAEAALKAMETDRATPSDWRQDTRESIINDASAAGLLPKEEPHG